MNRKNIGLVYKKEIQGAIRDRRTLISMVVVPLIFYPLLFLGIGYFSLMGQKNSETIPSTISIIGAKNSPELVEIFEKENNITVIQSENNSNDDMMGENIHLTIDIPEAIEIDYRGNNSVLASPIIMHYDSTAQSSLVAKKRVTALIDTYRRNIIEERLNKIGLNNDFLEPFQEQWMDIAPQEKKIGFMLGSILPYLIIILIFIGAMNSAVDITAGEKERGTLATLLVSQLNRLEIVLGKYFSVMTISAISMFLGLIGLSIAFLVPAYMLGEISIINVHFSFPLFLFFFLILAPLVGFASAILILIGIFARNTKEASTYTTPIYMGAIFLGMLSLSQGIELSRPLFFIPILNNSFVFKELLMGTVNWAHISATLISNIGIALLALFAAAKLFNKENVIFRS
ncbi:MAG: ABC transporter permease subunit [Atribacterota bacterium]|jgi:sodium transport system permease protein|nr:ABC transporter permease subunit [Atribacterota bacterium]